MNRDQFAQLPELVRASDVRALLGIVSDRDWEKVKASSPQIRWRVPGMMRERYIRREVLRLLPAQRDDHSK